jgi:hypothetical protein
LQGFINDGTQSYDDMLNTLFTRKIKTEMVIYQEELKIVRLKYALLVEDELNTREKELIRLLEHKKECKVTLLFLNVDPNIVGSIRVMGHLACDLGQVTLLQLPHPGFE